jgi:hypothetical protein
MTERPWEVWFYAPTGGRKLVDRFNTRGEAEQHRSTLGRLIGQPSSLTICYAPPVEFQNF